MKGTRHSEEQIIGILKQGEAGLATVELCRQHNIPSTPQTYALWVSAVDGSAGAGRIQGQSQTRVSALSRGGISDEDSNPAADPVEWSGRQAGGELEQIQLLLRHASIQTTERYLGKEQNLSVAVNDGLGLEMD